MFWGKKTACLETQNEKHGTITESSLFWLECGTGGVERSEGAKLRTGECVPEHEEAHRPCYAWGVGFREQLGATVLAVWGSGCSRV